MPSGIGGNVVFPTGTRSVRRWNLRKHATLEDATDSGATLGWKLKEATLFEASGTVEVLWKAGASLDGDMSIEIGDVLNTTFKIGTTGFGYTGAIVVGDIETTNDAQSGALLMQTLSWESQGPMVGPIGVV